jgi:hypothetical protein
VNAPHLAAASWSERYETLRRHVLEGRQVLDADPLGLILLFRQGVAGWMRCWSGWVEPAVPARSVSPLTLAAASTLPWQDQLTVLLAHMTSAHLHPE